MIRVGSGRIIEGEIICHGPDPGYILIYGLFFFRKMLYKPGCKIIVTLRKLIFRVIIVKCQGIKTICIQTFQFQFICYAEIFEILVQVLTLIHASDIVHAGIENASVPGEGLQVSSHLAVLLEHTYVQSLLAEDQATFQASQTATDDNYIVFHYCFFRI